MGGGGLGFRVEGLGFRVWSFWFRALGRLRGLRFRGSGFGVAP